MGIKEYVDEAIEEVDNQTCCDKQSSRRKKKNRPTQGINEARISHQPPIPRDEEDRKG